MTRSEPLQIALFNLARARQRDKQKAKKPHGRADCTRATDLLGGVAAESERRSGMVRWLAASDGAAPPANAEGKANLMRGGPDWTGETVPET